MTLATDPTHDPQLKSWVKSAAGHRDFPIQNLPLGVFSPAGGEPRAGMAIGDWILDLKALAAAGLAPQPAAATLNGATLNGLFALAPAARQTLRETVSALLCNAGSRAKIEFMLHEARTSAMHLPAAIGDYTDFYVGIHHAQTVGSIYRPDTPLQPNYKYIPIGYHGRASSVRPSGTPVVRPKGQTLNALSTTPVYGPAKQLDYEMEVGIWIGQGNDLGQTIPIGDAPQHIVGLCLLNDWSARDIQNWERLPLGPFLAKSFLTSISPWVVTAEALAPYRIAPDPRPAGDPAPLPYLSDAADAQSGQLNLDLEVSLLTRRMREAGEAPHQLSRAQARDMYWTFAQIVTHHASNGCNLAPGDLLGTGTISGVEHSQSGSLLELSRGGKEALILPNGEARCFLEDGDEVIFQAYAKAAGRVSIGFGECRGVVLPAS